MNNIDLLNYSLENREPFIEPAYQKEQLIISTEEKITNKLEDANQEILEKIIAYKVAREADNKSLMSSIIDRVVELLSKTKNINNSEFVNYWLVNDMSFSCFTGKLSLPEKKEFIAQIIPEYLIHRHKIYHKHGYSPVSLQVVCDSKAHKRSGNLGLGKVSGILEKFGVVKLKVKSYEEFVKNNKIFITPDCGDQKIFEEILKKEEINFNWMEDNQNKYPDFLIKINNSILIVEHKHIKEGGGGQNKQLSEIINFIKQNEGNINAYYVSFLDGIYFNMFVDKRGKVIEQYRQIISSLDNNKNNYFVNTAGFNKLIEEIS